MRKSRSLRFQTLGSSQQRVWQKQPSASEFCLLKGRKKEVTEN
ncbi:hypothetical protein [Erwinia sp.]